MDVACSASVAQRPARSSRSGSRGVQRGIVTNFSPVTHDFSKGSSAVRPTQQHGMHRDALGMATPHNCAVCRTQLCFPYPALHARSLCFSQQNNTYPVRVPRLHRRAPSRHRTLFLHEILFPKTITSLLHVARASRSMPMSEPSDAPAFKWRAWRWSVTTATAYMLVQCERRLLLLKQRWVEVGAPDTIQANHTTRVCCGGHEKGGGPPPAGVPPLSPHTAAATRSLGAAALPTQAGLAHAIG